MIIILLSNFIIYETKSANILGKSPQIRYSTARLRLNYL